MDRSQLPFFLADHLRLTRGIIAIDGASALGKSTLATALGRLLHATLIGVDSYLIPRAQRTASSYELSSIHIDDFFHDMHELREGRHILLGEYERNTGTIGTPLLRTPTAPLIVEGVHAFVLLAAARIPATRIFLDAPEAVMRAQRAARDERRTDYLDRWGEHFEAYQRVVLPSCERADIVITIGA